jgi:hypothetical protein
MLHALSHGYIEFDFEDEAVMGTLLGTSTSILLYRGLREANKQSVAPVQLIGYQSDLATQNEETSIV